MSSSPEQAPARSVPSKSKNWKECPDCEGSGEGVCCPDDTWNDGECWDCLCYRCQGEGGWDQEGPLYDYQDEHEG